MNSISRRAFILAATARLVQSRRRLRGFAELPKLAQKETYKVGFAQTESNNPWRIAQTDSMKAEAEKSAISSVYTDAAGSAAKQVADVNSMIAQGVDVIFLAPREEKPLIPAVMAAKKAGIPVILLDRNVDPSLAKAGEDYVTFIGSDFIGRESASPSGWRRMPTVSRKSSSWKAQPVHRRPTTARRVSMKPSRRQAVSRSLLPSQATLPVTKADRWLNPCCRHIRMQTSSMRTTTRWRSAPLRPSKPPARSRAKTCWCCRLTAARKRFRR